MGGGEFMVPLIIGSRVIWYFIAGYIVGKVVARIREDEENKEKK